MPTNRQAAASAPTDILELTYHRALKQLHRLFLNDARIAEDIEFVCRCPSNRAGVRMLLACLLAAVTNPKVDIRKPFKLDKPARGRKTHPVQAALAKDPGSYSGRSYDEKYIGPFSLKHKLPVNSTTSFLTPAYRTNPIVLTRAAVLTGKPPELYRRIVTLINDVHDGLVPAEDVMAEIIRLLLLMKEEQRQRVDTLLAALKPSQKSSLLSAEAIITLIKQHLLLPRSSRLPVLVVAAAYRAAEDKLGERHLFLRGHNVADKRAGALGDIEIALKDDEGVVTVYEMKSKRVTTEDIEIGLQKLSASRHNYRQLHFHHYRANYR